jgi:hypothetical protein
MLGALLTWHEQSQQSYIPSQIHEYVDKDGHVSSGVNYEAVKERIAAQANQPVRATRAARPPNAY